MSTVFAQSASAAPAKRAVSFIGPYYWDGQQWKEDLTFDITNHKYYNYYYGNNPKALKIPAGVTLTDGSDLKNLSTLVVPKDIALIGNIMSDRLKSLDIGKSNMRGFYGDVNQFQLPNLTGITASRQNQFFNVKKGVLYNKSGKTLRYYPPARKGSYYKVENTCRAIYNHAFADNKYLKKIAFPASVVDIREGSLARSKNLRELVFDGHIRLYGNTIANSSQGFSSCPKLTRIVLNHKNARFTIPVVYNDDVDESAQQYRNDILRSFRKEYKKITFYVKTGSRALEDVQEIGLKYQIIA